MVGFAKILLYVIPSFFLLAVVSKTVTQWIDARRHKKSYEAETEPVVLMLLGLTFLIFNGRFVPIVANIAEQQMRATPNLSAAFVGAAYGVTAVVLIASFAKAFWTHVNLEEGHWGPAQNYRDAFQDKPFLALLEFWLRVGIALVVVILQEQIAQVEKIDRIQDAAHWRFTNDAAVVTFIGHFDEWLAQTAFCAILFFCFILAWLVFVYLHNKKRKGSNWALFGTATFAVPGLILAWSLNYLATGSPFPSRNTYGQPNATQIIAVSDLLLVLAVIIGGNLIYTLCQSIGVFRNLWWALRGIEQEIEVDV